MLKEPSSIPTIPTQASVPGRRRAGSPLVSGSPLGSGRVTGEKPSKALIAKELKGSPV
jgi:hypothetical protein